MKIAFIVDAFPSISETFILNQMTGMIDLGHEVEILAGAHSDEAEEHEAIKKYNLMRRTHFHNDQFQNKFSRVAMFFVLLLRYGYKNPKAFFNSINIFKYGKEALSLTLFYKVFLMTLLGRFDVILCHFGPNGNLAAILKELGVPGKVVTMFHGYDIRRGIQEGGQIYKKLFENGDLILSISEYNSKHLLAFGANPQKMIHHPVGIELKKYTLRHPSASHSANAKIKIVTVSRLVKEKGLFVGLEAVAKLINDHRITNVEYQIAGDGPLREELDQFAERLGIRAYVRFLGIQSQGSIINLLSHSDIFFLPSLAEALPVVLMEAQAAGLPVVATAVGSVDQVMIDGETGFMVPSQNAQAMAEKLAYLIEHPDHWPKMGARGRQFIQETYDIEVLNKKLEMQLKQLIYQTS